MEVGDDPDLEAHRPAIVDGSPDDRSRRGWHRDDELASVGGPSGLGQLVQPAVDLDPVQAGAAFPHTVVQEADDPHPHRGVVTREAHECGSGLAGAVDERPHLVRVRFRGRPAPVDVPPDAHGQAPATEQQQAEERRQGDERSGQAGRPGDVNCSQDQEQRKADGRRSGDRGRDPDEISDTGEAPLAAVQAEGDVDEGLDGDRQQDDGEERPHHPDKVRRVEAECERAQNRQRDGKDVIDEKVPTPGRKGRCGAPGSEAFFHPARFHLSAVIFD
jgi:hypothetical protein